MDATSFSGRIKAGLILCLATVAVSFVVLANPVCRWYFEDGRILWFWPLPLNSSMHGWLLAGLLVLALTSVIVCRQTRPFPGPRTRGLRVITPLMWMVVPAMAMLVAPGLHPALLSNLVFFVPVMSVAWVMVRFWSLDAGAVRPRMVVRTGLLAAVGLTLLYAGVALYVGIRYGEHSGDEGHYLIQARSLYEDQDLDLRNNVTFPTEWNDQQIGAHRSRIHIAQTSRSGRWYSWHPYGLGLPLALIWPAGLPGRALFMGLIGSLGCVLMFRLSCLADAGRMASGVATAGIAGSVVWLVYATRILPEVPGALLVMGLLWAGEIQKTRPWLSMLLAVACAALLPPVQTRFLPLSAIGALYYGWCAWRDVPHNRRHGIRLVLGAVAVTVAWILYVWNQYRLFDGGTGYPIRSLFMSYPAGAWAVWVDRRGVLMVLPVAAWMLVANVRSLREGGRVRDLATVALLMTGSVLLSTCTNPWYQGGTTLAGRFLAVVMPAMVPATAWQLTRCDGRGRAWFLFLAGISIAQAVGFLAWLPLIGRNPVVPTVDFSCVVSCLHGLFHPYARFVDAGGSDAGRWLASGLGVLMMLTAWIGMASRSLLAWRVSLAATLLMAVAAHAVNGKHDPLFTDARRVSWELERIPVGRVYAWAPLSAEPTPLDQFSFDMPPDVDQEALRCRFTTADLGERSRQGLLSIPRMETNDWSGRPLTWVTLTAPRKFVPGLRWIRIRGAVTNAAVCRFAIRQGRHTLLEGSWPVEQGQVLADCVVFCSPGRGDLYILGTIEGDRSRFNLLELGWSRISRRLLRAFNLGLPPGCRRQEGIEPFGGP
ncbi:MAG: hypothetical protein A2498_02600 [Lentisphaerae bacterium RIFOXYC12_FULL_60_16]|nr:MAG: hypothetical protein A2498_02600 [Lentisphaerae bacterium RIFOXYC12_FULL_60_16]